MFCGFETLKSSEEHLTLTSFSRRLDELGVCFSSFLPVEILAHHRPSNSGAAASSGWQLALSQTGLGMKW